MKYYDIFEDKKAVVIDGILFVEADEVQMTAPPPKAREVGPKKSRQNREGGRRKGVVSGVTANILRLTREGHDAKTIAELTGAPLASVYTTRSRFKNKDVEIEPPTERLEELQDDEVPADEEEQSPLDS